MVNFGETNSANVEMRLVELQEALKVFGWYVRQSIVRRSILVDCSIMEKIPFLIILFELFPDFLQNFLRQIDFHLILNACFNFSSPTFGPKIWSENFCPKKISEGLIFKDFLGISKNLPMVS